MPSNGRHRQNAGNVSTQAGHNSSNDANINDVAKFNNFSFIFYQMVNIFQVLTSSGKQCGLQSVQLNSLSEIFLLTRVVLLNV